MTRLITQGDGYKLPDITGEYRNPWRILRKSNNGRVLTYHFEFINIVFKRIYYTIILQTVCFYTLFRGHLENDLDAL